MKKLFLIVLCVFATACNVDIAPEVPDSSYIAVPFDAFTGTVDGVETHFRYGASFYTCNPADLFVYDVSSGAAILNTDSSQVACTTDLFTRTDISETTAPLYGD